MAYIDTDNFLDLFYVASAGQDKQFIDTVEMVVSNTPTADVAEVKHGKWIEVNDGILIGDGKHLECSECGIWKKDKQKSNYCPYCGAKMDGHKKMTNYDRIKAMSTEEVISQLDSLIDNSQSFHEEKGDIWDKDIEALNLAKRAIQKQIPEKPIKSDREIRYCEVWKCPNCGFEWSGRVVDYCYKCGQAIDWENSDLE